MEYRLLIFNCWIYRISYRISNVHRRISGIVISSIPSISKTTNTSQRCSLLTYWSTHIKVHIGVAFCCHDLGHWNCSHIRPDEEDRNWGRSPQVRLQGTDALSAPFSNSYSKLVSFEDFQWVCQVQPHAVLCFTGIFSGYVNINPPIPIWTYSLINLTHLPEDSYTQPKITVIPFSFIIVKEAGVHWNKGTIAWDFIWKKECSTGNIRELVPFIKRPYQLAKRAALRAWKWRSICMTLDGV